MLHSHCTTTTPSPEHFLFCKLKILYPLNKFPFPPPPPCPGNHPFSTFCVSELDSRPHISGTTLYLSFCDWLITQSVISTRFIHVVANFFPFWGWIIVTNLDSLFKSTDITLPTKVRLVKATVFPVVMYGCESWTVKKAERQRIDAFELYVGENSWESLGLQGDPTSPF